MFPTDYDFESGRTSTKTAVTSQNKVGRSFTFDYKTKRFKLIDGKNEETTQIAAIEQWIKLFIRTEVNKYKIYSDTFGVDFKDLVGYRLPRSFIVSEIKRRITEGIKNKVPCIVAVRNWQFDAGHFTFTVETNTGEEGVMSFETN